MHTLTSKYSQHLWLDILNVAYNPLFIFCNFSLQLELDALITMVENYCETYKIE